MKALPFFGTIRCSMRFVCLLLLLACTAPIQLQAQSYLPFVSTGSANVAYSGSQGVELNGSASDPSHGLPNLHTWFQWGLTTAYGNVSPQVVNPQAGIMGYAIPPFMLSQPNTIYHYQAVASNSYGISYGSDATFTSPGPPFITNQPQSQAVAIGSTATFTVGAWAVDSVVFYQWEKNGVNITSATRSSFTITNSQSSDAGTYSVTVSSDWGGMYPVNSSPATLILGSGPPTIALQPTNQTPAQGATVSFTAAVSGAAPLSYQWIFDGTTLAGATSNVLTLNNVQPSNAGTYSLTVTNPYGTATSSNATLTINPGPPSILSQPANLSVYAGGTASFSVAVVGSLPLTYQWKFNGTNLNGATNSVLNLTSVSFGQVGTYDVVVSNPDGSVQSSTATLTILPSGSCYSPPSGIVSWWKADGNALDSVGTNNGTLYGIVTYGIGEVGQTFDFPVDGGSAVQLGNPTGLQLQNFTIEAWIQRGSSSFVSTYGNGNAELLAYGQNGYGFGMNNVGNLCLRQINVSQVQVSARISDTNWHHVAVTKAGTTVVFYIDGVAYPAPAYSAVFSFTSTLALGAAGDTLVEWFYGAIDEMAVYNRALSGDEIQAIFNAGSSGKCLQPGILSQPADQSVPVGGESSFSVTATGSLPLSYQWVFNGTNITGATNSSLTYFPVQAVQAGSYSVIISNSVGILQSSNATLSILPGPPCDPPASGLVSWWRAEGNALDSAGTSYGTLNAGVSYGSGMAGQAFVFSSSNAAVQLGNPDSLQIQTLTIEAWIKRSSSSVVSLYGDGNDAELLCYGSQGYGFGMNASGNLYLTKVDVANVQVPSGITDTNWHHVAVTKTGITVVFYVDGVAYPAQIFYNGFYYGYAGGFAIGARGDNLTSSFYGAIDELSVYDQVLSPTQIQAIYNAGAYGKCVPVPIITAEPTSQHAFPGCSATFAVTATSLSQMTYQWMKDGNALTGQTNSILSLGNVQSNDFSTYSVFITSVGGDSVTSSSVSLAPGQPPVAGADVIQRFASGGAKVRATDLLTNDSDADAGASPLSLIAVSPKSAANGIVTLQSNWVYYTPPAGFTNSDTFTYTISGGPCGGTNTGLVTVQIKPDNTPTGTFTFQSSSHSSNVLSFDGFPNRSYRIQYTGNLAAPNWKDLSTNVTDIFGTFQLIDSSAGNAPIRYYRAVSP